MTDQSASGGPLLPAESLPGTLVAARPLPVDGRFLPAQDSARSDSVYIRDTQEAREIDHEILDLLGASRIPPLDAYQ